MLVLPGLLASDESTAILRRFLRQIGYDPRPWTLGPNHGGKAVGDDGRKLEAVFRSIHDETGRTVSIVGWSLGGIMARVMAARMPKLVGQVIALGSGFTGDAKVTNAWHIYQHVSGRKVDDPDTREMLDACASEFPMPAKSIYSREDGVVAWQGSRSNHL